MRRALASMCEREMFTPIHTANCSSDKTKQVRINQADTAKFKVELEFSLVFPSPFRSIILSHHIFTYMESNTLAESQNSYPIIQSFSSSPKGARAEVKIGQQSF